MTTHRQVEVNGIHVDEGMAEILSLLWANGIRTQFSCQGGPSEAMIVFATVDDALRFIHGILEQTGYYGCYTTRLLLEMGSSPGVVRGIVRWPADFTQVWLAAWRNKPMPLDDALEIFEPGYKSECERLDQEAS